MLLPIFELEAVAETGEISARLTFENTVTSVPLRFDPLHVMFVTPEAMVILPVAVEILLAMRETPRNAGMIFEPAAKFNASPVSVRISPSSGVMRSSVILSFSS